MTRLLLSTGLVFCFCLSTAFADAPAKEAPKKPACQTKEKAKKAPLTDAQKAELAKKRAEAMEKRFKARDKNNDGKLTLDELKGKSAKPEAAARAEKLLKAKDKDGDGAISKQEMMAKPDRKKCPRKPRDKKKPEAKK